MLHTHPRTLKFHPHVYFVEPAGGLNKNKTLWLSKAVKYLCVANNLDKVFRATFIELVCQASYYLPANALGEWNVYMSVRVMVH
ncbi:transposase [Psychromonas antarctica]|nr:transposase [Psychromonas antarctica]